MMARRPLFPMRSDAAGGVSPLPDGVSSPYQMMSSGPAGDKQSNTPAAGDPGTQTTPAPLPKGMRPFDPATLIYMMTLLAPQQLRARQ